MAPPGRFICASSGYCARRRFQSQLFSASRCSSSTAWTLGCFFISGSFISARAARTPPAATKSTDAARMALIHSSLVCAGFGAVMNQDLPMVHIWEAYSAQSAPTSPKLLALMEFSWFASGIEKESRDEPAAARPGSSPSVEGCAAEQVAADCVEVSPHRRRGRLGVTTHQGLDDGAVLIAVDEPSPRAERTTLDVQPLVLASDQPQELMEMIEEFVARSGEDSLMQLRVPMLERRHFGCIDCRGMRGCDLEQIASARIGRREGGRFWFEHLPDRHHVDRAHPGQFLNDGHEIEPIVLAQKRSAPNLPRHRTVGCDLVDRASHRIARDIVLRRQFALVRQSTRLAPLARPDASSKRMLDFSGDQFWHEKRTR